MVGKNKGDHQICNLDFAVKQIDVIDQVVSRGIKFNNDDEKFFKLFTNMFADYPSQKLEIEEGNQLVGLLLLSMTMVILAGSTSW